MYRGPPQNKPAYEYKGHVTKAVFVYLMYHGRNGLTSNLEGVQQLFKSPQIFEHIRFSITLSPIQFPAHTRMEIRDNYLQVHQRYSTAGIPDMTQS